MGSYENLTSSVILCRLLGGQRTFERCFGNYSCEDSYITFVFTTGAHIQYIAVQGRPRDPWRRLKKHLIWQSTPISRISHDSRPSRLLSFSCTCCSESWASICEQCRPLPALDRYSAKTSKLVELQNTSTTQQIDPLLLTQALSSTDLIRKVPLIAVRRSLRACDQTDASLYL